MPPTLKISSGLALCLALAACSEPPPPPPSGPTVNSAAANEAIALFDQARAEGRGQLARAYAQDILAKYPGTEAAAKVHLWTPGNFSLYSKLGLAYTTVKASTPGGRNVMPSPPRG